MSYMRIYADFWRGRTGRQIAAGPAIDRCVATYLLTCQSANSEGLYRITVPDIAYDVGHRSTPAEIEGVMARLTTLDFLRYDPGSEFVWVVGMAKFQFSPLPLRPNDNRVRGIERWYRGCGTNPYLGLWWDMYAGPHALGLATERRDGEVIARPILISSLSLPSLPLPLTRDSEGAPEALQLLPEPERRTGLVGFDEDFWVLYPKHRARTKCQREWNRQKVTAQDRAIMRDKLSHPHDYWPEWAQGKIWDPINYLKDRHWLDEKAPAASTRANATPMPTYEPEWCHHEPRCHSRDWHEIIVGREAT